MKLISVGFVAMTFLSLTAFGFRITKLTDKAEQIEYQGITLIRSLTPIRSSEQAQAFCKSVGAKLAPAEDVKAFKDHHIELLKAAKNATEANKLPRLGGALCKK